MPDEISWLLLIYKVPTEPARQRAAVWRRVKALGAVYLQDGVAALPASPSAVGALMDEVQQGMLRGNLAAGAAHSGGNGGRRLAPPAQAAAHGR